MDINSRSIIVRMTALGIGPDQLVRKTQITKDRMGYILNTGKCEDSELNKICVALAIKREMILPHGRKEPDNDSTGKAIVCTAKSKGTKEPV